MTFNTVILGSVNRAVRTVDALKRTPTKVFPNLGDQLFGRTVSKSLCTNRTRILTWHEDGERVTVSTG